MFSSSSNTIRLSRTRLMVFFQPHGQTKYSTQFKHKIGMQKTYIILITVTLGGIKKSLTFFDQICTINTNDVTAW